MSCKLTFQGERYNSEAELQEAIRQQASQQTEEATATFNIVETPGFRTYRLEIEGTNEVVGRVRTRPTSLGWVVESSLVKPEYQNQGIGTEIYTEAIVDLLSRGETLYSDSVMEPQAKSVWDKLVSNDLAFFNVEEGRYQALATPNTLDSNGEASVEEVLDFVQEVNREGIEVTEQDKVDIINSLVGVESTDNMRDQMRRALMPNGVFRPTRDSLTSNGYNIAEADNILRSPELQHKLRDNLGKLESLETEIEIDIGEVVESASSTELDFMGRFKRANPQELEDRAIEELGGIQTEEEFLNTIEGTEFEVFRDQFEEFSKYKEAPVMQYNQEGQLEEVLKQSPADLLNTYMDTEFSKALDSASETIIEASEDILEYNYKSTETVLKSIEREAAKKGIDVTGLYETYLRKGVEATQEFLQELRTLNSEMSNENYKEAYDKFFDIVEGFETVKTKEVGSIVKIENSNKSAVESFIQDGMLYVTEGTYRKVDNTNSLSEAIRISESRLSIYPKEIFNKVTMTNRDSVRRAIQDYLQSEIENLEHTEELTDDQKKLFVVNSRYFSTPINRETAVKNVAEAEIGKDPQGVQRDLYKKMLQEKIKNSAEYENLYSKIEATKEGLELKNQDPITLKIVEEIAPEEFKRYLSLKKDSEINFYPISEEVEQDMVMRNQYFNFPQSLAKYKGIYNNIDSNTITVEGDVQDFIRTAEGVYELVDYNGQVGYYSRLGENGTNFIQNLDVLEEVDTENINIPTAKGAEVKINNLYTKQQGEQIQEELEC